MSEPIDVSERRQLCDLLLELGPDAPTLCEGWTTADLAAHIVLREHFRRPTSQRIASERTKGLPVLVARMRADSPLIPWRLPGLRPYLSWFEFIVHHEDVRRANGFGPRTDVARVDEASWRLTGLFGRRLARAIRPSGLELVRPGGARRTFGRGPKAVLNGPPTELLLFLAGRRSAAEIRLDGATDAVAAVWRAGLKI